MKALGVLAALGAAVVLTVGARADVESGPKAGEKVAALKAFGVVGTVEGKEADFAADRMDAPTIYVFVSAEEGGIPVGGRPAARFMKALDTEVAKIDGAAVVAVWLGDKAFDKHKEYLPRINTSLKFEKTSLAAFDGEKSGPNNWGINPDAHLTVVVAHKGKVVKSFPFTTVNETDVRPVMAELKKAMDK
jgi:hypothetical protein